MANPLNKIHTWYVRFERPLSSISLVGGFVFDALTLKRVDLFLENFFVALHLLAAALGIVILDYHENKKLRKQKGKNSIENTEDVEDKFSFWVLIFIQFGFGGLFSVFIVYYFRSATLAATWPFMLLLTVAFILNERFKKHYTRLTFQLSLLFLSIYAFAIYLTPVILHRISPGVFILSGIVSIVVMWLFLVFLRLVSKEKFLESRIPIIVTLLIMIVTINAFYFLNLIPPLPVSLKDAGVFHSLEKNTDGNYNVTYEHRNMQQKIIDFVRSYQIYHVLPGEPIFVYAAVFTPEKFALQTVHQWQYYDEVSGWTDRDRVTLTTAGGREDGFRSYSLKTAIEPGLWRVKILAAAGQEIGRIKFRVVSTDGEPLLETETK